MESRDKSTVRPGPRSGDGLRGALRRLPAYVYLDDVFRGRHVLEVGCGEGAGAHYLARTGAASVIGLDRSPANIDVARARHRLANLTFGVADFAAIDLEDHAIDVVCVPSGEELARWPAFLAEARRVLAREGSLVVLSASADRPGGRGLGYHDLVGRLEPLFGQVRVIGMTPFVGSALVEFADVPEVLDVELDTSLTALGAGRDPVSDYVALAGSIKGPLRGYMVVELPAEGIAAVLQARSGDADRPAMGDDRAPDGWSADSLTAGDDSELRRRLARAVEERTGAEAEVLTLRVRLGQADEEIGRVAAQAARELGEARRGLHMLSARNESLEAQLAEARRGQEMGGAGAAELERMRQGLVDSEERCQRLLGDRADADAQAAELQSELAARDTELANLRLEMAPLEVMVRAAEQHEAEMRARQTEIAERDAYLEEIRQELVDVVGAERAASEEARDSARRAAELDQQLRELRGRLSVAEGELLRLRSRPAEVNPTLRARAEELEAALADRAAAADKAAARWREAEGKTDELWKKIGDLQKELVAAREQAVENARAQRQAAQIALTRAVNEAGKKLVSAQDQIIRTERERQELEREVLELRPRAAQASELAELRRQLADLQREREAAAAPAVRAQAQLALLQTGLQTLEAQVRAEGDRLDELGGRLLAVASELAVPEPPEAAPPAGGGSEAAPEAALAGSDALQGGNVPEPS